ncbi:MAG: LacI family transcriptional regulator, partial [Clostridiales bacterium]|nr:LacI family transcriptional regulator [Clostridiales bacterium]
MNIRDIAKLANVSVSTVSKIINNKSESISIATREKVLRIVKEYNYTPYDGVRPAKSTYSFLIGVLISQMNDHPDFLNSILDMAGKNGYSTIVCISRSGDKELRNLAMLLNHRVDGLIWDQMSWSLPECAEVVRRSGVPVQLINSDKVPDSDNAFFDYHRLGYDAMESLLTRKHQQVMCIVGGRGLRSQQFMHGCQQSVFDHHLPVSGFKALRIDEVRD